MDAGVGLRHCGWHGERFITILTDVCNTELYNNPCRRPTPFRHKRSTVFTLDLSTVWNHRGTRWYIFRIVTLRLTTCQTVERKLCRHHSAWSSRGTTLRGRFAMRPGFQRDCRGWRSREARGGCRSASSSLIFKSSSLGKVDTRLDIKKILNGSSADGPSRKPILTMVCGTVVCTGKA